MVAAGLLAFILAAATAVMVSQNATYVREQGLREAQEQGREALDYLEDAVRMAGYGIDPQLAFDFDFYNCNLGSTTGNITQSSNCALLRRDSATQMDELVLYFRDPSYSTSVTTGCVGATNLAGNVWQVTAVTTGASPSVTLNLPSTSSIPAGSILQVMCQDASTYTYVTVKTAPVPPGSGCASTAVALEAPISVAGLTGTVTSPYSRSDLLTSACFSMTSTRAFLVDRERFFIHQDTANALQPRPYLMLDRGIDANGDGALDDLDLLPIAADIEDLQIAYVLEQVGILQTSASMTAAYMLDSNADGVWGNTSGVSEQLTANSAATTPYGLAATLTAANTAAGATSSGAACLNVSLAAFNYPCVMDKASLELSSNLVHPYRWLPWTGNIAAVRLGVIARSASATAQGTQNVAGTATSALSFDAHYLPALENRAQTDISLSATGAYATMKPGQYQHSVYAGAVRAANLSTNGLYTF